MGGYGEVCFIGFRLTFYFLIMDAASMSFLSAEHTVLMPKRHKNSDIY